SQQDFCDAVDLFLKQRFAPSQLHQRHRSCSCVLSVFAPSQLIDARTDFVDGHLLPAVKRVGGIAPGAAKIAASKPDKNARKAGARSFSLSRLDYFVDKHDVRSVVLDYRPDFALAVPRASHQIAAKNTAPAMIKR